MAGLLAFIYFAAAIAEFFAFLDGVHMWLGWGTFSAVLLFFGLHFFATPGAIAASCIALYGATHAWGWPWWQAALLVFPAVAVSVIATAAVGLGGLVAKLGPAK